MSILEEETRQIILKKTWCHGQSILPIYSIFLIAWSYHGNAFILVPAACVLCFWSFFSYRVVFHLMLGSRGTPTQTFYPKTCIVGIFAMISHLSTFLVAIQNYKESTTHLLMSVASGLLFVETGAFLVVVTTLREEIVSPRLIPNNHMID